MFIFIVSRLKLTLFPTEIICPNWSDQRQQIIHFGYANSLAQFLNLLFSRRSSVFNVTKFFVLIICP